MYHIVKFSGDLASFIYGPLHFNEKKYLGYIKGHEYKKSLKAQTKKNKSTFLWNYYSKFHYLFIVHVSLLYNLIFFIFTYDTVNS